MELLQTDRVVVQLIQRRRFQPRIPRAAEVPVALVVGDDQQNIRAIHDSIHSRREHWV
ncbi:MAG: hypothetical protein AAF750_00745 [Planctomycetota bacterium]